MKMEATGQYVFVPALLQFLTDNGRECVISFCPLVTEHTVQQRCADMYPRIDILRISVILLDTDRIQIVISLFERLRV